MTQRKIKFMDILEQLKKEIKELNTNIGNLIKIGNPINNKAKWIRAGNLEWSECLGNREWYGATKKCKELGGRLPTRVELLDLLDNHPKECKDFVVGLYWSSTEDSETDARNQGFPSGTQYHTNKTNSCYVRCVREANNN